MNNQHIFIRETGSDDLNDIMKVEKSAFGYDKEAELTAAMLNDQTAQPHISLLAFSEEKPVGHILFTRAYLNNYERQPLFHILAPLAIIPEFQGKGIGGMLIREGLKRIREIGSEMAFVLGHISYYPRHGFIPDAKKLGYSAPYPIPEPVKDAWMVQTLTPNGFTIPKGKILCCDELNRPEHWRE